MIPIIVMRQWQSEKKVKKNGKRIKLAARSDKDVFLRDDILNPVDMAKIELKARNNSYKSLEEFFVDVQWFVHNCEIVYLGEFHFMFIIDTQYIYFEKMLKKDRLVGVLQLHPSMI